MGYSEEEFMMWLDSLEEENDNIKIKEISTLIYDGAFTKFVESLEEDDK